MYCFSSFSKDFEKYKNFSEKILEKYDQEILQYYYSKILFSA